MKLNISFSLKTWDKNRLTNEQFEAQLKEITKYSAFSLNDGTVQYYPEARNGVLVKADITFKGESDQDLISYVSIDTNNYYKALKEYLKVRDLALWISQK